jgi:hypothetical protein
LGRWTTARCGEDRGWACSARVVAVGVNTRQGEVWRSVANDGSQILNDLGFQAGGRLAFISTT